MSNNNLTSAKSDKKLQYGFTSQEVVSFIQSLRILPSDNLFNAETSPTMNIGIAQVAFREYNSLPDYLREMDFIIKQGVNQHAHIICLPMLSGLLPASLFPQYKKVVASLKIDDKTNLPTSMWIHQAVSAIASECFEIYYAAMSAFAKAYNVYIMAGSTIYPETAIFRHRALLFGPDGKLVGFQDKLSTTELEDSLQIESGSHLKVFSTPMGDFSILIGTDVNHFETAQVSNTLGARIIFNPTAFIAPYTGVDAALGLNLRVQEQPLFGIQSTLIGKTPFGFSLDGPSGVFAPLRFSLPNAKNGMYIRTIKQNQTQLITARISENALDTVEDDLTEDKNPEFIKKYINSLY